MAGKYTYRLTSEGFAEFQAQMNALGDAGAAAFDKIKAKMPEFAAAEERATKRAEEHKKALEDLARTDFQNLHAGLDRTVAAQQQLARGRETVTTAQKLGVATDAEAAAAMRLLEQRYASATAGVSQFSNILGVAKTALGAFGIALGVGEMVRFGVELFKSTAELEKQSKVLGVGIEALQAYRAVAVQSSVDVGTADAMIQRFTRSIGEANESAGQQRIAFRQLGLSAADLAGGPEAALPMVASALLRIEDVTRRARIETALLGKSGQEAEAMLRGWADPEIVAHMKAAGLVIDEQLVQRADEFGRAWDANWLRFKVGLIDTANLILSQQARFELAAKIAAQLSAPRGSAERPGTSATSVTIPIAPNPAYTNVNEPSTPSFSGGSGPGGPEAWVTAQQRRLELQREEVRLAGEMAFDRKVELEAVAQAQLIQRDRGVQEEKLVQTYAQARDIVGAQGVEQIKQTFFAKAQAEALGAQKDRLAAIDGLHDQILPTLEKETKSRIDAAVQAGIQAESDRQMLQIRKDGRALRENEYLAEQVRLAALLPEYRQAELFILQQELDLNQKLTEERKNEIRDQFALIQQTERLTDVAQDLRADFKSFWMEFATEGRLNTKDLFKSVKSDFASLLYDMLIEAKLRPIMINMVGSMQSAIGSIGNLFGLGGSSSSGGFGYGAGGGGGGGGNGGGIGGMQLFGAGGGYGIGQPSLWSSMFQSGSYDGVPSSVPITPSVDGKWANGTTAAPGWAGYVGLASMAVNGIVDAIQGDPTKKNTRLSGTVKGAATGAAVGTLIFPGIGTVVGAVIGAIAGLIGGHDKPSNYTAYANFTPDMYSATYSGDKPNAQTTSAVQGAANQIISELSVLRNAGVSFATTLKDVWIGQRDVSSYQLAGGKRVAIGTVGDTNDLALQAIKALIGGSSTESPALGAVLKRNFTSITELNNAVDFVTKVYDVVVQGRPQMTATEQAMKAVTESFKNASQRAREFGLDIQALAAGVKKSFDSDIMLAIEQIQDPLKYALDLWQRDAQARLDTAAMLGADLEPVKQLNALLRGQAVNQVAGNITGGLTSLIAGLQYGSGSAEAPSSQYFSALTAYNNAKSAALGSLNPSDISAFQSASQTFLPIARGFLGTSQQYGDYTQDVIGTANQLIQRFTASSVPDLTPVVTAQHDTTAAVQEVKEAVNELNIRFGGLFGVIEALARRAVGK